MNYCSYSKQNFYGLVHWPSGGGEKRWMAHWNNQKNETWTDYNAGFCLHSVIGGWAHLKKQLSLGLFLWQKEVPLKTVEGQLCEILRLNFIFIYILESFLYALYCIHESIKLCTTIILIYSLELLHSCSWTNHLGSQNKYYCTQTTCACK